MFLYYTPSRGSEPYILHLYLITLVFIIRGSRKFFQRESNFDNVFFLDEGIRIPLKAGHHRPASETPFQWRFADVPMMAHIECWHGSFVIIQGIGTSIAKKPYICVIFQVGGGMSRRRPYSARTTTLHTRRQRRRYVMTERETVEPTSHP